jgi:hypothetical protein
VANEIYTTTRDGLAALVSRQVAEGVLRRAASADGIDPDVVDARTMSRLLRGRVRRTLERTLPRRGVRRHLAAIDARIAHLGASQASVPAADTSEPSFAEPLLAEPLLAEPLLAEPLPPPSPRPVAATPPSRPPVASRPRRAGRAPALPPDAVLDRLERLDAVRQWIWTTEDGRVEARGAGPDAERARRLLAPIVTVLERADAVRSVHVQHGHGHVLVGRAPEATFTVAGDLDVNLGAIYAAFRALKEEP